MKTLKMLQCIARIITLILLLSYSNSLAQGTGANQYNLIMRLGRGNAGTVKWHPSEEVIGVGGNLGIWLYTDTLENITHLEGGDISSLEWSPDGSKLASGSVQNSVDVWDISINEGELEGRLLYTLRGHSASILSLEWSPDGSKIASVSIHETVIWNVETGSPLHTFENAIFYTWSPDGTDAVIVSYPSIEVVNITTGEIVSTFTSPQYGFYSLEWGASGIWIIRGSGNDNQLYLTNLETGQDIGVFQNNDFHLTDPSRSAPKIAFSPDTHRLAISTSTENLLVWDIETGEIVTEMQGVGIVNSMDWSPSGDKIVIVDASLRMQIWDTNTGSLLQIVQEHTGNITDVAWSPDGSKLASVDFPNLRVWDVNTWKLLFVNPDAFASSVVWSPDGSRLATPRGGTAEIILIWDGTTGEPLLSLDRPYSGDAIALITRLAWSPDGTKIASNSTENSVLIWDLSENGMPLALQGHSAHGPIEVDWSPDSTRVVSGGSDGTIRIWNIETQENTITVEGNNYVDWSSINDEIASVSSSNRVQIWDAITGNSIVFLVGHADNVLSLSWNPNGNSLASSGMDGTIRIWDSLTGETNNVLNENGSVVNSVDWNITGDRIASAHIDGTIRIWEVSTIE